MFSAESLGGTLSTHIHTTAYILITLQELPKVMAKLHTDVVEMEKTAVGEKSLVVQDATVSRVLDSDQVRDR